MLPGVFGPKEGQPEELDEDVEEDDSPPVAEIAEIDSGNEPTDRSEVVRDPTKGKTSGRAALLFSVLVPREHTKGSLPSVEP